MTKIEKQKTNIEQLLGLIKANPELEIVPMVDYDVCASEDYSSWMGEWSKAEIDEIYHEDERIYFRSEDEDEIAEKIYDSLELGNPNWTHEHISKLTDEKMKEVPWEKAIVVRITTP